MNAAITKWRVIGMTLSVAATVVVLGCSSDDSGLAARYKVSGKVTYKGATVPKAGITFEPTNPAPPQGRHASGFVENGYYTLTTGTSQGDGALPGEYKVVIVATNVDTKALSQKTGGLLHQGDAEHVKAIKNAESLVPLKYGRGDTTPLTAKVETKSNEFNFDLTD